MPTPINGQRENWQGRGYKRYDAGRGWVYYIRKKHHGKQYEKSTGVMDDPELAELHFKEWQRNPEAYDPRNVAVGRPPRPFDEALVIKFLEWQRAPESQGGKGNSEVHLRQRKSSLTWWLARLAGRDLRRLDVSEINAICPAGSTSIKGLRHKRDSIRTFVNWLRQMGDLKREEGPDMEHFKVPQTRDLKLHGRGIDPREVMVRENKGKNAAEGFEIVCGLMPVHWREHMNLLGATGWHATDLKRWIEAGAPIEPVPADRVHEGAAMLPYIHKTGVLRYVIVSEYGRSSAEYVKRWNDDRRGRKAYSFNKTTGSIQRVRRSAFPYAYFIKAVRRAAKRAGQTGLLDEKGLRPFGAGHVRHAVATVAAEAEVQARAAAIRAFEQAQQRRGHIRALPVPSRAPADPLEAIRAQLGHAPGSPITANHYVDPAALAAAPTARHVEVPRKIRTLV